MTGRFSCGVIAAATICLIACKTPQSPTPTPTLSLSISPQSVIGGSPAQGTVTLTGAPAGSATVALSTSNAALSSVPASVTVPAGSSSAPFTVTTSVVGASTAVTITAAYTGTSPNITQTAMLAITPTQSIATPPTMSSISINPSAVVGGNPVQALAVLSGAAPAGGAVVTLSSNDTAGVITSLPPNVTVPAGASTAAFNVSTRAVGGTFEIIITGSFNGTSAQGKLTVQPASVFPFYVYVDESDSRNHFVPSGFFGDTQDLTINTGDRTAPHSGSTSIRIDYVPRGTLKFAGIFWQNPEGNWGAVAGAGYDLRGAREVQFWARATVAGTRAEFKVGGITGPFPDSLPATETTPRVVQLATSWQQFSIDVSGRNLAYVIGGFMFVTNATDQNPGGCTIFLDDIVWR